MGMAFTQYPEAGTRRPAGHGQTSGYHAGGAVRVRRPSAQEPRRQVFLPPGWPVEVPPRGSRDWELAAVGWLLDQCPADYRAHPVLRRHPVVLARMAAQFVDGQIESSRRMLGTARAELGGLVSDEILDQAASTIQTEGARLVRVRRAVGLVETALRGEDFVEKL